MAHAPLTGDDARRQLVAVLRDARAGRAEAIRYKCMHAVPRRGRVPCESHGDQVATLTEVLQRSEQLGTLDIGRQRR